MSKIKILRQAYQSIHPNMPIMQFINIAGYPDSCIGTLEDGILTWSDSVWKGIFRGGSIKRQIIIGVNEGKIVQYSSENLNVSSW